MNDKYSATAATEAAKKLSAAQAARDKAQREFEEASKTYNEIAKLERELHCVVSLDTNHEGSRQGGHEDFFLYSLDNGVRLVAKKTNTIEYYNSSTQSHDTREHRFILDIDTDTLDVMCAAAGGVFTLSPKPASEEPF